MLFFLYSLMALLYIAGVVSGISYGYGLGMRKAWERRHQEPRG